MKGWLEDANLEEATCLYWVLGDVDMVLRVWATASEMATFHEKLATCGVRWKRFEILLINQMSTWYQRDIQKKNTYAGDVKKLHGCDWAHKNNIPATLTTVPDPPASKKGTKDIQFLIFLETQYTTRSTLFYELAAELGDKQDEDMAGAAPSVAAELLKGFQKVSLYSYCTEQQQGVIIKGQVAANLFETLVQALVVFSSGVRHGCFRTVTYVCTTDIRNSSPFRTKQGHEQRPERKEIAYNLLKSQDCTFPQHDSPPKATERAKKPTPAGKFATHTDSEEQRNKLRDHFLDVVTDESIWPEFFVWSPRWWKNIEYLRLLFRWVVGGEGKNKQLIASLMRHYARLEMELRKVMPGADARDVMAKAAEKRLRAALNRASFDKETIERVMAASKAEDGKPARSTNEDDPFKLTLGTIAKKLEALHSNVTSQEKSELLVDEVVLTAAIPSRNELMHGEATQLHSSTRNGDTLVYEWEKHLRPFVRFYLRYPTLRARIAELWKKHGSTQ